MRELIIHAGKRLFMRREVRRAIPGSWREVPAARRLLVLQALFSGDGLVGRVAALRVLLQLPQNIWMLLTPVQVAELLDATEWLNSQPSPVAMLPSFNHNGVEYVLPSDNFQNGTCKEFPLADDYLNSFLKTGNGEDLLNLVATLCREANTDAAEIERRGDRRVPLHSKMSVENRAQKLKKLPETIQLAVMLYFIGVKILVNKLYGEWLFERKSNEQEDLEGGAAPKKPDPLHWWGLFIDAADGDPLKLQAIHDSNFHTFCTMECRRRKHRHEMEMKRWIASPEFGKPQQQ